MRWPTFLAVVFLLAAHDAPAQSVQGRVIDAESGAVIPSASVQLLDRAGKVVIHVMADDSGRFVVKARTSGEYTLEVESIGYRTVQATPMKLEPDHVTLVEVRLSTKAILLDPITVTAPSRIPALERVGYYKRLRVEHGKFIDRAAIEKRNALVTTDLFRGVLGVTLKPTRTGHIDVYLRGGIVSTLGTPYCKPKVYLNGLVMGRFNFDVDIHPYDIEAMELYRSPAEVPAQFGGAESACGVILLWTRSGGSINNAP